jgi:hypothetical protein
VYDKEKVVCTSSVILGVIMILGKIERVNGDKLKGGSYFLLSKAELK